MCISSKIQKNLSHPGIQSFWGLRPEKSHWGNGILSFVSTCVGDTEILDKINTKSGCPIPGWWFQPL